MCSIEKLKAQKPDRTSTVMQETSVCDRGVGLTCTAFLSRCLHVHALLSNGTLALSKTTKRELKSVTGYVHNVISKSRTSTE